MDFNIYVLTIPYKTIKTVNMEETNYAYLLKHKIVYFYFHSSNLKGKLNMEEIDYYYELKKLFYIFSSNLKLLVGAKNLFVTLVAANFTVFRHFHVIDTIPLWYGMGVTYTYCLPKLMLGSKMILYLFFQSI